MSRTETGNSNTWRLQQAFTLIELMVVAAIIAILAGILLAAVGRAKSKVRTSECLNNLKQWGMATHLFAADNDDYLPKDGSPNGTSLSEGWYVELPKVMDFPSYRNMPWRTNASLTPSRSVWICPSNPRRSNGNNLFHYCLNSHVNGSGVGNRVKLGSILFPSQTIWLFDNGGQAGVAQQNNVHTNLHGDGAHFLFLDGHAERFKVIEYWDFKAKQGITNNPKLRWRP